MISSSLTCPEDKPACPGACPEGGGSRGNDEFRVQPGDIGADPKTVKAYLEQGIRSLDELRDAVQRGVVQLTAAQALGLAHVDDLRKACNDLSDAAAEDGLYETWWKGASAFTGRKWFFQDAYCFGPGQACDAKALNDEL